MNIGEYLCTLTKGSSAFGCGTAMSTPPRVLKYKQLTIFDTQKLLNSFAWPILENQIKISYSSLKVKGGRKKSNKGT